MKPKDLTQTFMIISNWKNPFGLHGYSYFSVGSVKMVLEIILLLAEFCLYVCKLYHSDIPEIKPHIVASELKDSIWHSLEWQIGSFSSEATICISFIRVVDIKLYLRGSTIIIYYQII